MLSRCPREFFFQFYPWGEPEEKMLWFLQRHLTFPLLVGSVAHEIISMTLRKFQSTGQAYSDLKEPGLRRFEEAIQCSRAVAERARKGFRPQKEGPVIREHLLGRDAEHHEGVARQALVDALDSFIESEAWRFLKTTNRSAWKPIPTDTEPKPSVVASVDLGFGLAVGVRLYTPYDLAISVDGHPTIIDFKTGRKTEQAVGNARWQMTAYSLAFLKRRTPLDMIRIQPCFLAPSEPWAPEPISQEQLDSVRNSIERHILAEKRLVREEKIKKGAIYRARREDFPPRPNTAMCANCKFMTVCPEGTKSVKDADKLEESPTWL